jgi:hypothetical protein
MSFERLRDERNVSRSVMHTINEWVSNSN